MKPIRFQECRAIALTAFAIALLSAGSAQAKEATRPDASHVQRAYVNGPYGQIHLLIARPASRRDERHPPLACFHYSPGSSRMYAKLLPYLATDRVVMAFDTPGYGGSDAPASQPTLPDYARALTKGLSQAGYGPKSGKQIDVVGHLTGSLIATELAVTQPRWIRRVVLAQAPNFDAARRLGYVAEILAMGETRQRDVQGQYLVDRLTRGLNGLAPNETLDAYMGTFIDGVIPGHKWTYGEVAAISYPAEDIYRRILQPVLLFTYETNNPQDFSRTPTLLRNVRVVPVAARGPSDWHTTPEKAAQTIRAFLDAP